MSYMTEETIFLDSSVATCKVNGIRKIATFDEDFKKVDFLEVSVPSSG